MEIPTGNLATYENEVFALATDSQNRKRFLIMKKSTINFIIDVLMFICMAAIAGIGFLIKYTLISGQERWSVYGENVELYLFGMDRHEWGSIHLIIGFVLLGLLVLHIILHWKLVVCIYNRIIQRKLVNRTVAILFTIICALFIISPFLVKPTVYKIEQGSGRQISSDTIRTVEESNTISQHEKEELNNAKSIKKHHHDHSEFEIKGYMTLEEVSGRYKVPTNVIKTKLNIPETIPDNQRMSWLRKKYKIEMSDVKKIVQEYQEQND